MLLECLDRDVLNCELVTPERLSETDNLERPEGVGAAELNGLPPRGGIVATGNDGDDDVLRRYPVDTLLAATKHAHTAAGQLPAQRPGLAGRSMERRSDVADTEAERRRMNGGLIRRAVAIRDIR